MVGQVDGAAHSKEPGALGACDRQCLLQIGFGVARTERQQARTAQPMQLGAPEGFTAAGHACQRRVKEGQRFVVKSNGSVRFGRQAEVIGQLVIFALLIALQARAQTQAGIDRTRLLNQRPFEIEFDVGAEEVVAPGQRNRLPGRLFQCRHIPRDLIRLAGKDQHHLLRKEVR